MKNEVLVVGAGYMAQEYIKYLKFLKKKITLIGKTKEKVNSLKLKFNLSSTYSGGLKNKNLSGKDFKYAIVAVNEKFAAKVIKLLIQNRVKNILIEKPGAKNINELINLNKLSKKNKCNIYLAYNRRFYESIEEVNKIIKKDKGILSADFSFTEWTKKISKAGFEKYLKKNWFYFNSLHLIDLIFFLIGKPKKINSNSYFFTKEFKNNIFTGNGISTKNIPFSYHSNWISSGSWMINLYTKKRKIILSPLEEIKFQEINKLKIKKHFFKKRYDIKFKAGLGLMIDVFFTKKSNLLKLNDYLRNFKYYSRICGFNFY
jgi:predicted dehydrogenase